jgi:hypothetical protein
MESFPFSANKEKEIGPKARTAGMLDRLEEKEAEVANLTARIV